MRSRNKNHKVLRIPFYFRPAFRGRATWWGRALFGALFKKINISLNIPKYVDDAEENFQFPRNQCMACNDIVHDRNHPLLLFGSSREAHALPDVHDLRTSGNCCYQSPLFLRTRDQKKRRLRGRECVKRYFSFVCACAVSRVLKFLPYSWEKLST